MILDTVEKVIMENKALCFQDTSMALELICEDLIYKHGLDASWCGRSIYIDDTRAASIQTCREGKGIVGICGYTILRK
jgi:hypothetical protein